MDPAIRRKMDVAKRIADDPRTDPGTREAARNRYEAMLAKYGGPSARPSSAGMSGKRAGPAFTDDPPEHFNCRSSTRPIGECPICHAAPGTAHFVACPLYKAPFDDGGVSEGFKQWQHAKDARERPQHRDFNFSTRFEFTAEDLSSRAEADLRSEIWHAELRRRTQRVEAEFARMFTEEMVRRQRAHEDGAPSPAQQRATEWMAGKGYEIKRLATGKWEVRYGNLTALDLSGAEFERMCRHCGWPG